MGNFWFKPMTKTKRDCEGFIESDDLSLAPIVESLDILFEKFNVQFFEGALTKPIITLSAKGTKNVVGWCSTEKIWQKNCGEEFYELNICPEDLNKPIEVICKALLHEMCHLYNFQNNKKDCSRSSQYHNKLFRETAEKHGLDARKNDLCGYSDTSLKSVAQEFIKSLDLSNFDLYRHSGIEIDAVEELRPSSTRKYVCPLCKTSIRATKDVRVRCDDCNVLFIKQTQKRRAASKLNIA